MRTTPIATVLAAALLAVLIGGCQPSSVPEAAVPVRVESPELGIAIADLPEFFHLAVNEGTTLELVPADPEDGGRLTIVAGQGQVAGVNLVQAVWDHKAKIEGRPGGEFLGQRELGTHLGTAFYSRGQYQGEGEGVLEEETAIFVIHPWGDRRLDLIYRYPAGDDTSERLEKQLFAVLGQIEGLTPVLVTEEPAEEPEPE